MSIKVTLATDPGPAYGLAVAPQGWWWFGGNCVAPEGNTQGVPPGSYFSQADLNRDGTVTLHDPPDGWQANAAGMTELPASAPTLVDKIEAANASYAAAEAALVKPAVTSGVVPAPAPGSADVGFFADAGDAASL